MLIAVVSICMVSCQNGGGMDKAKEILNELKEKGATLDKAQLKDKVLTLFEAMKPVVEKMKTALNAAKEDPKQALEIIKGTDFQEIQALMADMKVLDEIPAMKELADDPDLKKAAEVFEQDNL